MANKVIYQRVAVTDEGDIIPGAEYTVTNENTGLPLTIYSSRAGAAKASPYFADAAGIIQFWTDPGVLYRVEATGGVGTYTDRYVEAFQLIESKTDLEGGRALTKGAFGAGEDTDAVPMPGNDANLVTATGVYKVDGGSLNTPATTGTLTHKTRNSTTGGQRHTQTLESLGDRYSRGNQNGSWGNWQRIDPQAFGYGLSPGAATYLGNVNPDSYHTQGVYFGNWSLGPYGSVIGWLTVTPGDAVSQGRQHFEAKDSNLILTQRYFGSVGQGWQEIYHTGNLNQLEFGGAGATVAFTGFAASATSATFELPVSLVASPSSITVTNTFSLVDAAGGAIAGGATVTPTLGSNSSFKVVILNVGGLSGMTVGEKIVAKTNSSASKIVVNP